MNDLTLNNVSKERVFRILTLTAPIILTIISFLILPVFMSFGGNFKINWEDYVGIFIINIMLAVLLGYIGYSILIHYMCDKECKCRTSRTLGFYFLSLVFFGLWPIAIYALASPLSAIVLAVILALVLTIVISEIIDYHIGLFFGGTVAVLFSVILIFLSARAFHHVR